MANKKLMSEAIEPFRINVPDRILGDLRNRLIRTRFLDEVNDDEWSYGTSLAYLRELCDYWSQGFDWRAQEAILNRFDQFTTGIDDLKLHFIHMRSKEPDALPLLITHGWPSSIAEFAKIIGPLTNPVLHGGEARDAVHVICPSVPGFGFSEAARKPGMGLEQIAKIEAKLMARLGYERYGVQGGDWGSWISQMIGIVDSAHCIGIHCTYVIADPPEGEENPIEGLSSQELAYLDDNRKFQMDGRGYAYIQGTKPQTIGYALNDSPAGLASWIIEKFRAWSDCEGDIETRFTKDELLTNITIYWVTETITSSARLYREDAHLLFQRDGSVRSVNKDMPTGVAVFPGESRKAPRRWIEKRYNLQQWTEMPSGGHFAALEEPELLVSDMRSFFRKVR
ncbi:epoxide hydrolase family protein [Chloroflexota bacterium]